MKIGIKQANRIFNRVWKLVLPILRDEKRLKEKFKLQVYEDCINKHRGVQDQIHFNYTIHVDFPIESSMLED